MYAPQEKRDRASRIITALRKKYPNPLAIADDTDRPKGGYCVGSAITRTKAGFWTRLLVRITGKWPGGRKYAYPTGAQVTAALLQHNDTLTGQAAFEYGQKLNIANDAGNFEGAWDMAQAALQYPYGD